MSAVRRKPNLSLGLPSGIFDNQPSKDEPDLLKFVVGATRSFQTWNGRDLKEDKAYAIENGAGSIRVDGVGPEVLTEEDTKDIVRRVREHLEKQGPSQESELLAVLPLRLVRRLRTSFDNLAALVERLPGFHHVCEDRYSFLYYLSPEEDDDGCFPAPPDLPPEHESTAAKGGGFCNSDEGAAKQGEVKGKRNACSQTPSSKRAELECEMKERAREVDKLEQRLEALRLDQERKRQALRFKIEQRRTLQVTLPPMPSFREEDDGEGDKRSGVEVGEELPLSVHPLLNDKYVEAECTEVEEEEPHMDPGPKCADAVVKQQEYKMPAVLRIPVPDFYDLHMQLEQSTPSSEAESLWSSWGGDSPNKKNKAEAQIAKIVKMLIKKQPVYTEFEMRQWVDEVRRLQGGFSRMTLNAIVSLVLDHMKKRGLRLRIQ